MRCRSYSLGGCERGLDRNVPSVRAYFALRDYREGDGSLAGQVGNEPTPEEFLQVLWTCTEEWMRVLKPCGSIFVNLGDKYDSGTNTPRVNAGTIKDGQGQGLRQETPRFTSGRRKSLMGLPWRYTIGCMDQLGLTLRQEIIWNKPNALPDAARDRCRRVHEHLFHFTRQGDYYSSVDRIREEYLGSGKGKNWKQRRELGEPMRYGDTGDGASGAMVGGLAGNPLGRGPADVWDIPTQPLNVPSYLAEESLDGSSFEFDHYAAFPEALVQRVILGWSPKDVCTKCGQGRFPVSHTEQVSTGRVNSGDAHRQTENMERGFNGAGRPHTVSSTRIVGTACACTPYTDRKPGNWRGAEKGGRYRDDVVHRGGGWVSTTEASRHEEDEPPRREYHFDQWEPAESLPGVVCDPFGGTGTTAITAAKLSRRGITCDLSYDYAKQMVDWRMHDLSQNRRKK